MSGRDCDGPFDAYDGQNASDTRFLTSYSEDRRGMDLLYHFN